MKKAVRIAVTGAAGQIGYALLFRIASGAMLGKDQPVILQLLEIPQALEAVKGVVMELRDCAFPLLQDVLISDNANEAFNEADFALLVGARPRGPGMERSDLLQANAAIFSVQGKALNDQASKDVKVLVVGNPANTNALIAQCNAPNLDAKQFTAMTRLDHNRALFQLANQLQVSTTAIKHMTIWGNHSATQYPDISQILVNGELIANNIDAAWYQNEFIPTVAQRGAAIIKARGASSAASAASAAIDHMRNWSLGTEEDDWVSMAIPSDGSYGIEPGVIYSYPVTCKNGQYEIVQGLEINEFSHEKMTGTYEELLAEKQAISHLID